MNTELALDLLGYLGSVLILVSMLMTSVVRLRVINIIGSAIFAVYALLIRSYPTAFLNACLVGVNVYQLIRLKRTAGKSYELQRLSAGDGFAEWFTSKYSDDIKRYFPNAEAEGVSGAEGFAVLLDDKAAGILLGTRRGESFDILLDYTTPAHRDCSVGRYLFGRLPALGITELTCSCASPEHAAYMEKMGFALRENGVYVKSIEKPSACSR